MVTKSKLSFTTSLLRQGNSMPVPFFRQTPQTDRPGSVQMSWLETQRTKYVVDREAGAKERQKAMDKADADMYIFRQELQGTVLIEGDRIAHDISLARQSILAESNEVTANGVTKMERERSARTEEYFKQQSAKEESLRQSVLDGKMPEKYAQILADDYLESTCWLADGDKAQTRQLAESLRLFSLIPMNFKGSASQGEDS